MFYRLILKIVNKNKYLQFLSGIGLGALLLAGCATVDEPLHDNLLSPTPAVRQCAEAFRALDAAVERAGVGDAEARRIAGFPYLRVDRYHAHLRDAAGGDARASDRYAQWVSRLHALDHDARRAEISTLPAAEIHALQGRGRAALLDQTARCADTLRRQDLASPQRMALLHTRAQVPDSYATWQRVAGFYALMRVPFYAGIVQWHNEMLQAFQHSAERRTPAQPLLRYALTDPPAVTREALAAIIRRASENPLRLPEYSSEERALLASAFAPVFEVETGGAYDRIGRLQWGDSVAPQVDTAAAVVYYRIAYTAHDDFAERTLTQIVYTIWFSERPHDHAWDLLAGRLDGVMLRVTLSPHGEPLVYDSIHACGCYHLFFPTARVRAVPAPQGAGEWAFAPATLPAHSVGARVAVRVATRTHYLVNVALDKSAAARSYTLLPEDALRSLPLADGQGRSVYGADGIIAGTARSERVFFWPMGIPSAGAMRQWGRHATAFVGRRHFDDADLIGQRFRMVSVGP